MKTFSVFAGDRPHRRWSKRFCLLVLSCLLSISVHHSYGQTGETGPGPDSVGNSVPMSFLEGKTFTGDLGPVGKPAITTDLLLFRDGMFISEECQNRCGYTSGPYWMRSTKDGIQVRAETPCLTSDASIVWNGTVKGDTIEGTFTFTSNRWYWTVQKEFWFNGKLVESDVSVTE